MPYERDYIRDNVRSAWQLKLIQTLKLKKNYRSSEVRNAGRFLKHNLVWGILGWRLNIEQHK